jgi:N-acetylmuramic acid 6-phosphate etherase
MGSKTVRTERVFLGLECGATRTVALAQGGHTVRREFGPANLRLLSDVQLGRHFRAIAKAMPRPAGLAIGMAGARTEADRGRIRRAAAKAWPRVPCYATSDLETALAAAEDSQPAPKATVLVLSGTGSCCFGLTADGRKSAKVGGWGHILGDKGSGFEIGLRALKAVLYYLDCDGRWSTLGQRMLRALQLNEPENLIGWVQSARKDQIAGLAIEVFRAAATRDRIALDILAGAASGLAKDAVACAARLAARGRRVQFVLAGGVLLRQPWFAASVGRKIRTFWPGAYVSVLRREGVWGAVELARRAGHRRSVIGRPSAEDGSKFESTTVGLLALSPTEQRNPASMNLDKLSVREAIELMLREDAKIPPALLAERKLIESGVNLVTRSLRRGGRLFYVGAGTSGRLGVLDASECPPTFRTDPEMVQGIIAGGQTALWSAVEGAEDDPSAGARAVQFRGVAKRDTVVGIAASGRTPFVRGALREAKRRGAATILLCFNPHLDIPRADRPTLVIAPKIGPEILTGSTRLKSGTATKLILNIFTTLAMVRLGKVLGNLMIDVKASNTKLRDRAVRIVRELTGADYETARVALLETDWKIKPACGRLRSRKPPTRRPQGTRLPGTKKIALA